jgi:hypothetical protein
MFGASYFGQGYFAQGPAEVIAAATFSLLAEPGSYDVVGSDALTAKGYLVRLDPGVYAFVGADLSFVIPGFRFPEDIEHTEVTFDGKMRYTVRVDKILFTVTLDD